MNAVTPLLRALIRSPLYQRGVAMVIKQHPASTPPLFPRCIQGITWTTTRESGGDEWSRFSHHGVSSWDCSYNPHPSTLCESVHAGTLSSSFR